MRKIFIACAFSKYLNGTIFTDGEFAGFLRKLYQLCQTYASKVFLAAEREKYGKNLMPDVCTELDFEEMKSSDLVVAIPDDSKGVAVELGWASWMQKRLVLILNANQRYTPLISGLGDITETTILSYEGNLDESVLSRLATVLSEKQ